MNMFLVSGIGLALFIEILLLSKRPKSAPDRILATWMLIVAAQLALYYLYSTGSIYEWPALLGVDRPLPILHGVMLYLYVSSLTGHRAISRQRTALLLLPTGLMYLYLVKFFLLPPEQKIEVYRTHGAGFETFNLVRRIVMVCSSLAGVAWSIVLLKKYRASIADRFSNLDRINLRWLQFLTYSLGAIWFLYVLFQNDGVVFPGVVLFVFAIGFLGIRQTDIFAYARTAQLAVATPTDAPHEESFPIELSSEILLSDEREKYQKSGLTEAASLALHEELLRTMTAEALYKDSELSIDSLAARLNVHPNHLSQVINQREGRNFYDFVNGYRVEEFKRLVAAGKNEQLTLLALALESGFNSKTSFNRCFKKATGETPSQFIASVTANVTAEVSAEPANN